MKLTLLAAIVAAGCMLGGCQKTTFTPGDAHRTIAHSQVTQGMTDDEYWSQHNRVSTVNLRSMHEDWIRLWLYDRPSRSSTYPIN